MHSGYFGIYFPFVKIEDIGITWEERDNKYSWHDSFDVESLIVWDLKAYNEIYAINLLFN